MNTLGQAFYPIKTTASFAVFGSSGSLRPAYWFALLTIVPLGFLRGLIPWTQTLSFGPSFDLKRIDHATDIEVAVDLLRAGMMSLLLSVVFLAALTLPFVSLCRAYGQGPHAGRAALRALLYRGWLLSVSMRGVLFQLAAWGLPAMESESTVVLILVLDLVPLIMLGITMRASARIASGLSPLPSFAAVMIPFLLMFMVEALIGTMILRALGDSLHTPITNTSSLA